MRRYWLGLMLLLVSATVASAQSAAGFTPLFNGKNLDGWKPTGKADVWGAENGILHVTGGGGRWLITDKTFKNFELRLEYKMPKKGNSGVALRTPAPGDEPKGMGWDPAYVGMEIQLIDEANWTGLKEWQNTGSIYNVVPAKKVNSKPFGEWNNMRIVAKGKHVLIEQNGEVLVDANLADYEKDHAKKHPGILREGGHLGLQSYNFRVEFRNILVKTLD